MTALRYNIFSKLIRLIYPEHCAVCDKLITQNYFCDRCRKKINRIDIKLCLSCGLPVKLCSCKYNFYYFKYVVAPFENKDEVKDAFYSFKFDGNRSVASFFAKEMALFAKEKYNNIAFDFVTFVPCHKSKKAEFGYDRVGFLAAKTAKELELPLKSCLKQPKATESQHTAASVEERFKNVRNKYRVKKGFDVKGKSILLIDDIITTGATLSECARELKLAGAKEVYALAALNTFPKEKADKKPLMTLAEKIELSKK